MNKKVVISFLVLSILLSGCLPQNLLSLTDLEQNKVAESPWKVAGNSYTTISTYETPAGEESNVFTLVIENNIIKSVEVGITTTDKTSIRYQNEFARTLPSLVVGKDIKDLPTLDRISGASVTTSSFNKAITELKEQLAS